MSSVSQKGKPSRHAELVEVSHPEPVEGQLLCTVIANRAFWAVKQSHQMKPEALNLKFCQKNKNLARHAESSP